MSNPETIFENPPVLYYDSPSRDRVAILWEDIQAGKVRLVADEQGSYLRSVLELLDIPVSSQCLVFFEDEFADQLHLTPKATCDLFQR